jgi:hypothetical protein
VLALRGFTAQQPKQSNSVAYFQSELGKPDLRKDAIMTHGHRTAKTWLGFAAVALSLQAGATGLATCESGPKSSWQPVEKLEAQLKAEGWTVRRIKEDGGCYEAYVVDANNRRAELYFHPVTLAPVPTKSR